LKLDMAAQGANLRKSWHVAEVERGRGLAAEITTGGRALSGADLHHRSVPRSRHWRRDHQVTDRQGRAERPPCCACRGEDQSRS